MDDTTFDGELVTPIPADMELEGPLHHPTLGASAMHWAYRGPQGSVFAYMARFNLENGEKEVRPRTTWRDSNGKLRLQWRNLPPPRPLYGLEYFARLSNALVIVIEGEKAVDAARRIFPNCIVVSPMNGAKSPGKADWEPLRGRDVIIWPDNDKPGEGFAIAVAGLLQDIAASVRIVDVAELVKTDGGARGVTHNPIGWDAADAVEEWTNLAALRDKVLELARPCNKPADPEVICEELFDRIEALDGMDESAARAIVIDATKANLSDLAVGTLLKPLAHKLGVRLPEARKFWKKHADEILSEIASKEAERAARESAKNAAKLEQERREAAAKAELERREALRRSCESIATDRDILTSLTKQKGGSRRDVYGESLLSHGNEPPMPQGCGSLAATRRACRRQELCS
jgi:DNA primase